MKEYAPLLMNDGLDPSRLGVRHEVFETAAVCPIHCDEKNAWFDTKEFIVTERAESAPGIYHTYGCGL
jgi:hypothetical protein